MSESYAIPFNQSSLQGMELEHISRTMTIGQIAGDQTYQKDVMHFWSRCWVCKR